MSRFYSAVFAVFVCVWASVGTAAETVPLMEAQRIILQSADERAQTLVLRDALREVMIRASGDVNAPNTEGAVQNALQNPNELLARFGFGASEVMLPDAIGNLQPTFNLELAFDGQRVRSALVDSGLNVWGATRPSVMVFLAAPNATGMIDLLGDMAAADGITKAREQARVRGVPLQWPLLDLEDLTLLTADDVWSGFAQPMLAVADRYGADAVLGGYVGMQPDTGNWVGRWHFVFAGEQRTATFFGESQRAVIEQGVNLAADTLAARYAVDHRSSAQPLDIEVLNVTNVQTHGAVRRYLRDVNGVSQVQLQGIDGDVARYRLMVRAPEEQLLDIMALEARLQPQSDVQFGDEPNTLSFVWLEQ